MQCISGKNKNKNKNKNSIIHVIKSKVANLLVLFACSRHRIDLISIHLKYLWSLNHKILKKKRNLTAKSSHNKYNDFVKTD
jgi:hypothetical protein